MKFRINFRQKCETDCENIFRSSGVFSQLIFLMHFSLSLLAYDIEVRRKIQQEGFITRKTGTCAHVTCRIFGLNFNVYDFHLRISLTYPLQLSKVK